MKFSPEERRIMLRHSIAKENIVCGGHKQKLELRDLAKNAGCEFVFWKSCRNCNCKIRTPHGICVECNPGAISDMRQHGVPGYIYIAKSKVYKIVKVGSSKNVPKRLSVLNCGYANVKDWEIHGKVYVEDMGKCESEIKKNLSNFRDQRDCFHSDGKYLSATEFFNIRPDLAYGFLIVASLKYKPCNE